MDNIKSDYQKGLVFFIIIMICIVSWFVLPDGDTLFYKFIGLFGLSPGIPIGSSSTLYIYMLVPLIVAIVSIKKLLRYWKNYDLKFKEYNIFLNYLPVFIIILIMLFSNIFSPSLLDRAYYAVISQQNGLQAVTYYPSNYFEFEFTGNTKTYSYGFKFGNYSNETVEFNVKLLFEDMDDLQEIFIMEDNGELKTFSLLPKQLSFFVGEFVEQSQTMYDSWGSARTFTIVLFNENEQYSPKPLIRQPVF